MNTEQWKMNNESASSCLLQNNNYAPVGGSLGVVAVLVVGQRPVRAVAFDALLSPVIDVDAARIGIFQPLPYRPGAFFREPQIRPVVADVIGVSFDYHFGVGGANEQAPDLLQRRKLGRLDLRRAGVEIDLVVRFNYRARARAAFEFRLVDRRGARLVGDLFDEAEVHYLRDRRDCGQPLRQQLLQSLSVIEITDAEDAPFELLIAVESEEVAHFGDVVDARAAERHTVFDPPVEICMPEGRPFAFHIEDQRVERGHAIAEIGLVRLDPLVRARDAAQQRLDVVAMPVQPVFIAEKDVRHHIAVFFGRDNLLYLLAAAFVIDRRAIFDGHYVARSPGGDGVYLIGVGPPRGAAAQINLGVLNVFLRRFDVVGGVDEIDRVGIVDLLVRVDRNLIVRRPVDSHVPIAVRHGGDHDRAARELRVSLPRLGTDQAIFAERIAARPDDFGLGATQ